MLLCGRFGKDATRQAKPLSVTEYNRLAKWLKDSGLRPSSLLDREEATQIYNFQDPTVDTVRLETLLKRGAALALALEKWGQAGLWVIGRSEPDYPSTLKKRLGSNTAPLLFGIGNRTLLNVGGVCVVGSRDVSSDGTLFAQELGRACAKSRLPVISGNAQGVDLESMVASYNAHGAVVGVLADNLLKTALKGMYRSPLQSGRMVLVSPFSPDTHFSVGNAMGRNKYLYALSDFAVIVESGTKGGTWEGAIENQKKGWVKAFVRSGATVPTGNKDLIKMGLEPVTSVSELHLIDLVKQARNVVFSSVIQTSLDLTIEPQKPDRADTPQKNNGAPFKGYTPNHSTIPQSDGTEFDDFVYEVKKLLSKGPLNEGEISTELKQKRMVIRPMLKLAVQKSIIEKKTRPNKYKLPDKASS